MRLLPAIPAISDHAARIRPALTSFADECCGTLARLMAYYVGTLALLAIAGVHLWNALPAIAADAPVKAEWSVAPRGYPAFAVSQFDLAGKTETYEIYRHPEGGRKDVFRWSAPGASQGENPVAGLEIYRPGTEYDRSGPAVWGIAPRMAPEEGREMEAAGVVDSKFGAVTLFRPPGSGAGTCLGFLKRLDRPELRISGWSCQGDSLPAKRAAISCMLGRLMLLTAANDTRLAELFARAELRRGSCAASTAAADWLTGVADPRLRGAF